MFCEYNDDLVKNMKSLYNSLSEKDRRRYAAVEAKKIGHGGIVFISTLLGCDEKTINKGLADLNNQDCMLQASIRFCGGGRKSKLDKYENIDDIFFDVLRENTAGSPMDEKVKWTNLTRKEISTKMALKGLKVSKNIVKKLLKKHGYVKRKALKKKSTGEHKDRNQQFENISKLRSEYEKNGSPIISIDAKKKEFIGDLYRDGHLECKESIEVYDHDFPNLAELKVTPYAVYDIAVNDCLVNIGSSDDTSEFVCDTIRIWWNKVGKKRYPNATSLLILADGGGSNSSRHHVFKESLQKLANKIGIALRMAHYPPYTSKWNPVEHKVFPHITRSLFGVILLSIQVMKELIEKSRTATGLKVVAHISKKTYCCGKKIAADFYDNANIKPDKILGQWNYVVAPVF
jgi:hypothetical protein